MLRNISISFEVLSNEAGAASTTEPAADEATLSRIFAGVHFRSDLTSGERLGREVAHFIIDNFLTRLDRDDESDNN